MTDRSKKEITEHLYNLESDVNLDELWSGVQKELFPKKRKVVFWLLPLILITGALVMVLTVKMEDSFVETYSEAIKLPNTAIPKIDRANKVTASNHTNEEVISHHEVIEATQINKEVKKQETQINKQITTSQNLHISNSNNSLNLTENILAKSIAINNKLEDNNISPSTNSNNSDASLEVKDKLDNNGVTLIALSKIQSLVHPINSNHLRSLSHNDLFSDYVFPLEISNPITPKKKLRSNWHISVVAGGGIFTNQMTDNVIGNSYRDLFDQSIEELEFVTGQLSISHHLPSGIYFSSGFKYTDMRERMVIDESFVEDINGSFLSRSETDDQGNETYNYQNNSYLNQVTREGIVYNNLSFVDLPINIGYDFNTGKLRTDFSVGLLVNISSERLGHYYNSNLISEQITEVSPIQSLGMSYTASMGLSYPLFKSVFLTGRLEGVRRSITYKVHNDHNLSLSGQLGIGIRM